MEPSSSTLPHVGDVQDRLAAFFATEMTPVTDEAGNVTGWQAEIPAVRSEAPPEKRRVDRLMERRPQVRAVPIGRPTGRMPRLATNPRIRGSRRGTASSRSSGGGGPGDSDGGDPEPEHLRLGRVVHISEALAFTLEQLGGAR
jgi:hypothetical protein